MSTLDQVAPETLYCLFKGEPGTRKSTQALSFPRPQFWLSWDRKMNGLLVPALKWGISMKDVSFEDFDDWSKARKKLEQLQVNCPYATIIADSITSMGDSTLRQTMRMKAGSTRSSGAQAGRNIAGIQVNELEDYNAESSAVNELIAITKDIQLYHKVNIILIAHVVQAEYRNTTTNVTHISRTIVTAAKKVAHKIPAYCGEVYHFNIEKSMVEGQGGDYTLLTEHTGDDFARTALPLPRVIKFGEKPLYDTWLKPAMEELKGKLNTQNNTNTQQTNNTSNTTNSFTV